MVLFTGLNFIFWEKIIDTYDPAKYKEGFLSISSDNKFKKVMKQILYVLYFTFFIFLGLRIDFEKLKLQNFKTIGLILLEYSIGIVCTAYILNIILTQIASNLEAF